MSQLVPQSFRSAWRVRRRSGRSLAEGGASARLLQSLIVCIAICFALNAPALVAQQPEPASGPPRASAPAPLATSSPTAGLRLAQAQGQAESAVVDWVLANSGPIHGDTHAGEFRVAFTVTPAEGWWDKAGGGKLVWHDAPANNVHLRIFVVNLLDGRLVPGLNLRATLIDANGNEQSAPADFGWYPLIGAYGGNFPLISDSSYTLRVAIDADASTDAPGSDGPPGVRLTRTTIAEFPVVAIAQNDVMLLALATANAESKEAELLKPCNAALSAAITALWQQSASGAEKPDGDYFIGYALDDSAQAKLRLKSLLEFSGKDNVRLEVLVRDSRTGRFIPGLKPQASLIAADGSVYDPGELALDWHPWLNHYGRNIRLLRKGLYTLRVSFEAPGFRRWGRQSEHFASPAEVEFDNLSLKPEAQKPDAPKPEGKSNP